MRIYKSFEDCLDVCIYARGYKTAPYRHQREFGESTNVSAQAKSVAPRERVERSAQSIGYCVYTLLCSEYTQVRSWSSLPPRATTTSAVHAHTHTHTHVRAWTSRPHTHTHIHGTFTLTLSCAYIRWYIYYCLYRLGGLYQQSTCNAHINIQATCRIENVKISSVIYIITLAALCATQHLYKDSFIYLYVFATMSSLLFI